jgi:hypothetical protein
MTELERATELFEDCKKAVSNGDDEAAHGREDDLRFFALECAINMCDDWRTICILARSTQDLKFSRWCA